MNNPNPFVPQGSLLEQKNKTRSRVKVAVFCVIAINVLGLMALLMQGCKRETEAENNPTQPTVDTNLPPMVDTNLPPMVPTNAPPMPPAMTTPTPPAVPEAGATEYVVVHGDTLSGIAKKFGVTIKAIEAVNPGVVPTKLQVGQKLSIPAPTGNPAAPAATGMVPASTTGGEEMYTVKSGDTLSKIAKAHGVTVKAIESENNLTTTQIKVGQKLKIPAATTAAPAPAPAPTTPTPAPTTAAPETTPGAPAQ